MKVTVTPEGEVVFDTEDVDQAVAMVKALRNGASPAKSPDKKKTATESILVAETKLTQNQYDTWDWIALNAGPGGAHILAISEAMGLTRSAASSRLKGLVKLGMVHSVRRGYWRAGEGPKKSVRAPAPTPAPATEPDDTPIAAAPSGWPSTHPE